MANTPAAWEKTVGLTMYEEPMIDYAMTGEPTWQYKDVMAVGRTMHATEKGYVVAGLGLAIERGNAEPIQTEDLRELEDWTATALEIALGVDWDRKLLEDTERIKNLLAIGSKTIGESFKQTVSIHAAYPFINAFDSTEQELYDGSALCDSVTSDWDITVDNDLPVATPGYDEIWDKIRFIMYDQRTLKGLKKTGIPSEYLYNPVWVEEITMALNNSHIPGTVTHDQNLLKSEFNIKPVQCIELTDTGATFLQGKRSKSNIRLRVKKGLTTEWDDHKKNRTRSALTHMVLLRYAMSREDIVGSPGP